MDNQARPEQAALCGRGRATDTPEEVVPPGAVSSAVALNFVGISVGRIVGGLIGSQVAQRDTFGARQMLLGKGAEALTRGLDKGAEFEADHVGIVLATRAGYVPYGLPSVLRRMAARNPKEASVALLFKTHPLPQERLERLGDAMGASFDRFDAGKALPERLKRLE